MEKFVSTAHGRLYQCSASAVSARNPLAWNICIPSSKFIEFSLKRGYGMTVYPAAGLTERLIFGGQYVLIQWYLKEQVLLLYIATRHWGFQMTSNGPLTPVPPVLGHWSLFAFAASIVKERAKHCNSSIIAYCICDVLGLYSQHKLIILTMIAHRKFFKLQLLDFGNNWNFSLIKLTTLLIWSAYFLCITSYFEW